MKKFNFCTFRQKTMYLYALFFLAIIFFIILPVLSGIAFYFGVLGDKHSEFSPITFFLDSLQKKQKLYILFPFCFVYLNLFLNLKKQTFNVICVITTGLSLLSLLVKSEIFLSYLEVVSGTEQHYFILDFLPAINSFSFKILCFFVSINIIFKMVVNWSRLFVFTIICARFDYLFIIQEQTMLYFPLLRPLIEVTFNRTVERINVFKGIVPNNSNWTKGATLAAIGAFSTGAYIAVETHSTRVATEISANAAVTSANAAVTSANAAVRAADVAEVQADLMSPEEFHRRYPKDPFSIPPKK